ncbi:AEC family transporter [Altericista sp. CCNU0014]|uniref:AEC family transporter n=1 Tax=Altericista sp. CCNU0014 TaxID=3082949 RepID=UPI00384BBBF1
MTDALFHAYASLCIWMSLGVVLYRILPDRVPRWIGRGLFWAGMPVEIFTLARHADFSRPIWLAPTATVCTLLLGLGIALGLLRLSQRWPQDWLGLQSGPRKGSFVLSSMLGNTGFVGLAIAASVLNPENLGLAAFFTVAHNATGLYGMGVLVAHHFGEREPGEGESSDRPWWTSLIAVLKVPSLWAFLLGASTQSVMFSEATEAALARSIWVVIPCGFLLMGMRLSQLKSWRSLVCGLVPAGIKVLLMPAIVALVTPFWDIVGEPRLALVLMAGTPTALTALVLAEEYNLDRELIASSIALSMIALIPLVPLWLTILS